jgi:hypothetical protein
VAIEVRNFAVTIPAGTSIASGFSASLAIPMREVTQIDIRVPPGPRGEVGFGIGAAGQTIVPYGGVAYIVTDDESLAFPLENTITSGAWVLYGYNTGNYPHTLYVYFHLQLVGSAPAGTSGTPLTGDQITGADTGSAPPPATPAPPTPPAAPAPPAAPPPPVTPPAPGGGFGALLLPPDVPLPGATPVVPNPLDSAVILGVADRAEVWLLTMGAYDQVTDSASLTALLAAGIAAAAVSLPVHQAVLAAAGLPASA